MHEGDHIVKQLRKLAKECDSAILELPRNPVGLPDGSFILDHFLGYIADCLVGKVNPTSNESKVDGS